MSDVNAVFASFVSAIADAVEQRMQEKGTVVPTNEEISHALIMGLQQAEWFKGLVASEVHSMSFDDDIDAWLSRNFDADGTVESAIQNYDFSGDIEHVLKNYDFGDDISSALDSYDFGNDIERALDDYDFSSVVESAVDDALDDALEEKVAGVVDNAVEQALDTALEEKVSALVNKRMLALLRKLRITIPAEPEAQPEPLPEEKKAA